jgi:hypothetical protein
MRERAPADEPAMSRAYWQRFELGGAAGEGNIGDAIDHTLGILCRIGNQSPI